jgi:predicted transcriptional regulator
MANQPDINNRMLSVRISRELYRKLQIQAKQMHRKFNVFVRIAIAAAVDGVTLTDEDYDQIKTERDQDLESRAAKRRRRQNPKGG